MENGKGRVGGWGVVLALVTTLGAGCAPRTEIGDGEADGQAGARDLDNGGGSGGTSVGSAGNGGTSVGNAGSAGGSPVQDCFDPMTADDSALLELGPNNRVFPSVRKNTATVMNYASQVVFDPTNWELNANFPPSTRSDDTMIQLPEELNEISENVGEVHITRPQCSGRSAAGRTVRVHAWWKLGGAIVRTPTEGIMLGTAEGECFADGGKVAVVGSSSDQTRPLNSLSPLVLEHTFAASDETDAGDLVLKLWLLETFDFPSTLYINRIEWD